MDLQSDTSLAVSDMKSPPALGCAFYADTVGIRRLKLFKN